MGNKPAWQNGLDMAKSHELAKTLKNLPILPVRRGETYMERHIAASNAQYERWFGCKRP